MGIFDRKCSQEMRMKYPQLYKPAYNSFGLKIFFLWVGNSILHSIMLFWLGRYLVGNGAVWESGRDGGYLVLGNFVYTVSKFWSSSNYVSKISVVVIYTFCFLKYPPVCGYCRKSEVWIRN